MESLQVGESKTRQEIRQEEIEASLQQLPPVIKIPKQERKQKASETKKESEKRRKPKVAPLQIKKVNGNLFVK